MEILRGKIGGLLGKSLIRRNVQKEVFILRFQVQLTIDPTKFFFFLDMNIVAHKTGGLVFGLSLGDRTKRYRV